MFKVLKNVQICNKLFPKYAFFNRKMYDIYANLIKKEYIDEFGKFMTTMGDEMMDLNLRFKVS